MNRKIDVLKRRLKFLYGSSLSFKEIKDYAVQFGDLRKTRTWFSALQYLLDKHQIAYTISDGLINFNKDDF